MSAPEKGKTRPLIQAQAKAAFDESIMQGGEDPTFLPGYSDVRRRIDGALAAKQTPDVKLTKRVQLVTITRADGRTPDYRKVQEYSARRYKKVMYDDYERLFGRPAPPQAMKNAEGVLQIGDAIAMYVDGEVAAKQFKDGQRAIEERSALDYTSQSLQSAGGAPGAGDGTFLQQKTDNTPV